FFFFQAEDGIRDRNVTGVQTCALPILGESMGAAIALESAGSDPRIAAVVAEASFANLREAAYDYAGLRKYPWLGKTLLSPFAWRSEERRVGKEGRSTVWRERQ